MAEPEKQPAIDYKKASSKDVQQALLKVTSQDKWGKTENWKFYLKGRNNLSNEIAKSPQFRGLDWRNPDNWEALEHEYTQRSFAEAKPAAKEGEIPTWSLDGGWMHQYPEIVQWMRKEHWRNNKAKLIAMFDEGTQTDGAVDGAGGGYWEHVMGQQRR